MIAILMLVLMVVLLLTGLPVGFAMGATSTAYLLIADIDLGMLTQRATASVNSFLILAIPFFYLAGELMNACKLTDRIMDMTRVLVGHLPGGLAQINVFSSMIFAGMSGSATADVAASGSILIPAMKKEGYPAGFAASCTVASAIVGPIIPPSTAMVIYAALADVSAGRMLLAGIVPGATIIAVQMVFCHVIAKRKGYPRYPRATMAEMAHGLGRGTPALLLPVIIVGGMLTGAFTPTEAAAVAVLYGLVLGVIVYRNVSLREAWSLSVSVGLSSSRILFIVAIASAFSWIMLREQVPQVIATALGALTANRHVVMAIMIVFLLVVGLFMVASSAEIVLTPILVPVVGSFGIDPVHFGVLMVFVLIVGGGTPPVGVLMYIAQDIAGISFAEMCRAMMPWYIPIGIAILLIAYIPELSLWIPDMVFGPA
ncbi:MAG: TRAP transporter large permease [Alphaproteobacteria bacterium]|nr:TRAP transporter large permease [Alphaproteobacteria bacterium]